MESLFTLISPLTLVFCCFVAVMAGVVKGAVGFAMPLVMISGLGFFLPPQMAVAFLILPIVVSNTLQTFRKGVGPAIEAVRDYWLYVSIVCVMIFVSAQFVLQIPTSIIWICLGIPVVGLSIIQLIGLRLTVPQRGRRLWEAGIATVSGVLGGFAGTWGPTTVLYLLAMETPKERQMVVQGVIYGLGSYTLLGAHLASGVLNAQTLPYSALLIIPGIIGMAIGFRIGDRLDQEKFRKAVLVVLILAGFNLIRRGLLGE